MRCLLDPSELAPNPNPNANANANANANQVTTDDPEVAERRRARARALLEERLQKAQCAAGPAAAAAAPVQ